MDTSELLQFVDEAMYAKTGKRLNDLHRKIIKGVLNHQKYADIADSYDLSEGHIKDVGYELLQMLSNTFNEPVSKSNLQSVLERQGSLNLSFGDRSVIYSHIIGCNFGSDRTENSSNQSQSEASGLNASLVSIKATVNKLRQRDFNDEEIADILGISIEVIRNV